MWLNIISGMADRIAKEMEGGRKKGEEEDRLINVYCQAPNEEESTHPWRQQLCDRWSKKKTRPPEKDDEREKGVQTHKSISFLYWRTDICCVCPLHLFLYVDFLRGRFTVGNLWNSFSFHHVVRSAICWIWEPAEIKRRPAAASGQTRLVGQLQLYDLYFFSL
jgi:hypothetical protein